MLRRLADAVSLRSREHKFRLFMEVMRPAPDALVVDVGVTDAGFGETVGAAPSDNYFEAMYPWPSQITAVGVNDLERFRAAFPDVRVVVGDGRALPFADGEFDIGFSNAVVEHVGDTDEQRAFVHELCRVARRVFVTTPNRWFPVEVHTLLPVVHWLPLEQRNAVFRRVGRSDEQHIRLLGPGAFRELFPYPVEVRNTGLQLIAYGGRD